MQFLDLSKKLLHYNVQKYNVELNNLETLKLSIKAGPAFGPLLS